MNKPNPFKTISSRIAYKNPWMQVREDTIIRPEGSKGMYGVVETKNSVVVIAADEEGRICLIHTFRYPAQKWCWELPMGSCGGEDPLVAGPRELREETGITAENWLVLGKTRAFVGLLTEQKTTLLATNLTSSDPTDLDEGIEKSSFVSLQEVNQMIESGSIDDDQTISALYLYMQHLDKTGSRKGQV